jgi:hypothetical protein
MNDKQKIVLGITFTAVLLLAYILGIRFLIGVFVTLTSAISMAWWGQEL